MQGKAPIQGNKKEGEETVKSGGNERAQWVAKIKGDAQTKENNMQEHGAKVVLKRTTEFIDEPTRDALLNTGLISALGSGINSESTPTPKEKNECGPTRTAIKDGERSAPHTESDIDMPGEDRMLEILAKQHATDIIAIR